jgi:hypothetical protein
VPPPPHEPSESAGAAIERSRAAHHPLVGGWRMAGEASRVGATGRARVSDRPEPAPGVRHSAESVCRGGGSVAGPP